MNIMLLTDIPPCTNFTAGIVLNQLCDFLIKDGHSLSCFAVIDDALNPDIPEELLSKMQYKETSKPREDWGNSKYKKYGSLIMNNYIAATKLSDIAGHISTYVKEQDVELIWNVVQGQSMILLASKVTKAIKKPYVVQVWDPPEWWLRAFKFDEYTTRHILKKFSELLNKSKTCLAASWAMAEEYSRVHNANCIPVVPGVDHNLQVETVIREDKDFVIGFAGQVYASKEMNALISGLNLLNWQHNGQKIKLVLYGRYFNLEFNEPANVEIRGWLKQEHTLSELSAVNLLYCPYWFDPVFEKEARLSFPSKLTSYLKTGKPVLVHGPNYASPRIFIEQNKAGYVCDTLDSAEIADLIAYIIDDKEREKIGERGYNAFLSYLTLDEMKSSFYHALGIE